MQCNQPFNRKHQAVSVDGRSRVRLAANSLGVGVKLLVHMARYGYRLIFLKKAILKYDDLFLDRILRYLLN